MRVYRFVGLLVLPVFVACSGDDNGNPPPQDLGGDGPLFPDTGPKGPDLLPHQHDQGPLPPDGQTPPPDGQLPAEGGPPDQGPPAPDQGGPTCSNNADCDDQLACTTNSCNNGKCENSVNPNFCAIAGQCVAIDTVNPQEVCQKCQPTVDPWDWSNYVCTTRFAGVANAAGNTDGTTAIARFNQPHGTAMGPSGEVYVADTNNHRIRMIANGQVSTLAGSTAGYTDGAAGLAKFNTPYDVAVGQGGEVYVADQSNHCIRMIQGGQVTSFAGTCGSWGYNDGPAASAKFNAPRGVAVGLSGEVYVADRNNNRIRMISGGQVSTLAGDGTHNFKDGPAPLAQFRYPAGVAVAPNGDVYVADRYNHRIRLITAGTVSTVAGTGAASVLYYPTDVAVTASGDIYICDGHNHRIRRLSGTTLTTFAAGNGAGYVNSPSLTVKMYYPWGLALEGGNTLYVGDRYNHVVRRVHW